MAASIGAAGVAALGSVLSNVIGGANSSKAMKKQFSNQSELQRQSAYLSYIYTRLLNQNAYQDTTRSMRASGINPMLAINNGINGLSANVSTGQAQMAVAPNDIDLATAMQLKNETKKIENDSKRVENETKLNDQNIKKSQYESDLLHEQAALTNEQNRQLQSYGDLERQQALVNSAKQGALLDAQKADVQNQIINRNLATNSAIQLNNANAKYQNERSRGFTDSHTESLGGMSFHGTHSRARTW